VLRVLHREAMVSTLHHFHAPPPPPAARRKSEYQLSASVFAPLLMRHPLSAAPFWPEMGAATVGHKVALKDDPRYALGLQRWLPLRLMH
jgi:hypothetical protein